MFRRSRTTHPDVDVHELHDAVRRGATVVDVREPHEYAGGHVPGARLIPLAQIPNRVDELVGEPEVHVICASGSRSEQATAFLNSQGVRAINVKGGTMEWVRAGKPIER
ncbi:MAG: rhodanese-like domain-containing protein [Actinomycetota bacterium]